MGEDVNRRRYLMVGEAQRKNKTHEDIVSFKTDGLFTKHLVLGGRWYKKTKRGKFVKTEKEADGYYWSGRLRFQGSGQEGMLGANLEHSGMRISGWTLKEGS